ncbi:DUF1109 domain-containing protein [Oxalobacteraceae bacterium CAVE-383]|nr:DUF1109 domain-containing protein [Oxalobacteraceae bacterium CAVE-383]
MKTNDLIDMLARGPVAVAPHATRRRYTVALGWGLAGALLMMALGLGVRPDLAQAATLPQFWFKTLFALSMTLLAVVVSSRLARPGAALKRWPLALAAPVLIVWLVAAVILIQAAPEQRVPLALGATWKVCTLLIATLSIPSFAALMWAMRGLAPTRLRTAGAMAGLLSGALAALVYCLHCPELEPPFVGIWYVSGMLVPTAAGALLGPRLLRW